MKICAACREELPRESFSKKQWQLKQSQRRCKECIDANREVQSLASLDSFNVGDASCWICLEEGLDESGKPPVRDCSCRGDSAGFAHLSCIVRYAVSRSEVEVESIRRGTLCTINLKDPWRTCPNCKQFYSNRLGWDLVNAFCSYAEKQHPGVPDVMLVALFCKTCIVCPAVEGEKADAATKMLFVLEGMKARGRYGVFYKEMEASAHVRLGMLAKDSKERIEHLEKHKEICTYLGDHEKAKLSQSLIAEERMIMFPGLNAIKLAFGEVSDDNVKRAREIYETYAKDFGEDNCQTRLALSILAETLYDNNYVVEAEKLGAKALKQCRRVHGVGHDLTKALECSMKRFRMRMVYVGDWNGRYQLLKYEGEHGEKCVVKGPFSEERTDDGWKAESNLTHFIVDAKDVALLPGTPVECCGLVNAKHLNGKVGDLLFFDRKRSTEGVSRFRIHFEDEELSQVSAKEENLRAVFNMTDVEIDEDVTMPESYKSYKSYND
ncbi:hypothetical protein ACHAWF_006359 [Thalassiosira exigua]